MRVCDASVFVLLGASCMVPRAVEPPSDAGALREAGSPPVPRAVEPPTSEAAREPGGTVGSPAPSRPGAYADLDPGNDFVVGPPDARAACETELVAAGVTWESALLPVHSEKRGKIVCGAPQVVKYRSGPGHIAYNSPPLLTCGMALALASFENLLQEEARRVLNARVRRVNHLGTYVCREIAAYPGYVSEHAYANAIDLASFTLDNGATVDVLRDFDAGETEPAKPVGRFLRAVSRRANDEDVFSNVLTPFFDAGHRNHFHLDLARFRDDGTRPRS